MNSGRRLPSREAPIKFFMKYTVYECVCVFLIDYPKINENRSQAHVRVYGFKFYKTRPVLERMCIAQAKQNKKTLVTPE